MKELAQLTFPGGYTVTSNSVPMGGITTGENILTALINLFLIIVMALAVIYLVWGGIRWTMSGGDPKGIEAARKQIIFALIGAAVAGFAYFIVNFVGNFLATPGNLLQ